jgi:hypothetical protein
MKFLLASIIFAFSVTGAFAQTDAFKVPDWLEFVEEIRIPNDQFSGLISNLSIDQAGNVLFNVSSTPYLFSRRLNQLIKLDPEGCRPGADPILPNSWFTPDGEIVANFGTSYFWFNLSGKCVHYVIDKTMIAQYTAALPGRNMVFVRNVTEPYTIERMDVTGNVILSAEVEKLPLSNLAYRSAGGGVTSLGGRFFWVNSITNTVVAFDSKFKTVWRKAIGLEGIPFFTEDITEQERADMSYIPRIIREAQNKAAILSLHAADRNTLLLHARVKDIDYFQLFDHDGNAQKLLTTSGYLRHNPNSRLFFRRESDDELIVYVYRMN